MRRSVNWFPELVGRFLGIDYGQRRIGLALSDPSGTIAQPLPTLRRRAGKRPPIGDILGIVSEQEVEAIVVGLPLTPLGDENEWTAEVREFARKLGERSQRPIAFIDERMTSARAERTIRSLGLRRADREDKGRVDAAAAVLILQAYLDARGSARN